MNTARVNLGAEIVVGSLPLPGRKVSTTSIAVSALVLMLPMQPACSWKPSATSTATLGFVSVISSASPTSSIGITSVVAPLSKQTGTRWPLSPGASTSEMLEMLEALSTARAMAWRQSSTSMPSPMGSSCDVSRTSPSSSDGVIARLAGAPRTRPNMNAAMMHTTVVHGVPQAARANSASPRAPSLVLAAIAVTAITAVVSAPRVMEAAIARKATATHTHATASASRLRRGGGWSTTARRPFSTVAPAGRPRSAIRS